MTMKIAILQFPGSNCERETMLAVKRAGMEPHEFLWNQPKELLRDYSGFVIVGGFSYEDRGRAGMLAAMDPIMEILKEQSELGKPILGICNGAQILVESGLVPGLDNHALGMTLTDNIRMQNGKVMGTGYYNAWIHMRVADNFQLNAFTKYLTPKNILTVPVAHAEGRFVIPPALLQELQNNGQCVFQYCDKKGNILPEFPVNPNGSLLNIAAVSNKAGNVMAMMPHPERTSNGDAIFAAMHDYIKAGHYQKVAGLHYAPREATISHYQLPKNTFELIVELNITDNQALSLNQAMSRLGFEPKLKRYLHWEIVCDSAFTFEKIKLSDVLLNIRKESIVVEPLKGFLVRAKDDMLGKQKMQMLKQHYQISGIDSIRHGILWSMEDHSHFTNANILFNPYAHDCYYY
ncbi:MAG TPA: phosphoribosylformylglycinamidine synthase I [Gammaproteobacteria bacterium]|jgi:phosphoribosylformylglycinamidine synthase|nr:phosphoribosylformylglycinamidine synthase I [Gammaproteobacteria bacterium]